jgi:hypothetical protein
MEYPWHPKMQDSEQSKSAQIIGGPVSLFFDDKLQSAYGNGLARPGKGDRDPAAIMMPVPVMTASLSNEHEPVFQGRTD